MQTTEQVQLIPLSKLHVSESNTRFPKATDPAIKELAKSWGKVDPHTLEAVK